MKSKDKPEVLRNCLNELFYVCKGEILFHYNNIAIEYWQNLVWNDIQKTIINIGVVHTILNLNLAVTTSHHMHVYAYQYSLIQLVIGCIQGQFSWFLHLHVVTLHNLTEQFSVCILWLMGKPPFLVAGKWNL